MSSRIADFLLRRLRREAARDALDLAISNRWLVEEGEKGREDEDGPRQVKVGHYFIEDDELGPDRSSGRRLQFGSKLEGLSRTEITRLLKREGIRLGVNVEETRGEDHAAARGGALKAVRRRAKASPGPAAANDAADPALVADVVRAIRASAAPPPVDEIAVVLLLADGIARSGLSEDQVLAILGERQPVVSILCPVAGFESRFQIMLKNGGLLPKPVAIGSGPEMRGLHVSFVGTSEHATKLVLFPGRQFDLDDASRMDARVGQAAASGYPLLGIAEKAERMPTALRVSASLDLECGPISTDLIAHVMEEVLGPLPDDVSLDELHADCAYLSLFDLPLAIRTGISHARAVEVLARLGAARRKEHDEEDGSSRDKSGSGSGSGKSSYRDRRVQGTGSDIIRPVPAETIACDPFVPTVERLHGYGTASGWAMALKDDLELWKTSQLDWSALSAKLLLSGPPGTGKTSFAKALCNSLQIPLIATSVSTWLEASYLGDVVRRMKAAFEEAATHAPCILFIDEIDGIGKRGRGRDYDDYWNTIVNKALELLDGAVRSSGIVIVAATNHPDVIDPALLRSGRLETHIRIPPPDIDALAGILRHHLGNDFSNVIATKPRGPATVDHRSHAEAAEWSVAISGSDDALPEPSGKPPGSGHGLLAAGPNHNTDNAAFERQGEGTRTC
ncbi:MAG: ATP-binding protein [Mesorhizobium sp.]|nr:ATP-binding protein [Mesorhizobium sp.]